MGESNQKIDAVAFDFSERVFNAGDLSIDLRDIGPRN
jgi:hypothetical protein